MKHGNISKVFVVFIVALLTSSILLAGSYIEKVPSKKVKFWGPYFFETDENEFMGVTGVDCTESGCASLNIDDDLKIKTGGIAVNVDYSASKDILCKKSATNCNRDNIQYILKHNRLIEKETQKSVINNVDKWYAISDVHGSLRSFMYLLIAGKVIQWDENGYGDPRTFVDEEKCQFADEKDVCLDWWRYKWSFGNGRLIIVGDAMDGDDNHLEILWAIRYLERISSGKVHFLLGNHEDGTIVGHREFKRPYDLGLAKKLKGKAPGVINGYARELFSKYSVLGKWLRTRNMILKINDDLFTHGGISPAFVYAMKSNDRMYKDGNFDRTLELANQGLKGFYNFDFNKPKKFFAMGKILNDKIGNVPAGVESEFVFRGDFEIDEHNVFVRDINWSEHDEATTNTMREDICKYQTGFGSMCQYNRLFSSLWAMSSPCGPLHYRGYWFMSYGEYSYVEAGTTVKERIENAYEGCSGKRGAVQLSSFAPKKGSDAKGGEADDPAKAARYDKILKVFTEFGIDYTPKHIITGHTEERSGGKIGKISAIPTGEATTITDTRVFLIDTGISGRHKKNEPDFMGEGLMFNKEGVAKEMAGQKYYYYRVKPVPTIFGNVVGQMLPEFGLPERSGL